MAGRKLSSTRVILLGIGLVTAGAIGFHEIPGMIAENAEGSKLVNAFYCSVMTLTTYVYACITLADHPIQEEPMQSICWWCFSNK